MSDAGLSYHFRAVRRYESKRLPGAVFCLDTETRDTLLGATPEAERLTAPRILDIACEIVGRLCQRDPLVGGLFHFRMIHCSWAPFGSSH